MTDNTAIVNRALQAFGARTTVTSAELAAESSNEAIQANLILTQYRDQLLRLAPWDCCFNYANLTYITSTPGTPENTSPATSLWQKGQPAPPYAYEFQYPVDCARACYIIPANQTGFTNGVPITTAVTGVAPVTWFQQPVKMKIAVDQFYPVTAATVVAGGSGYAVGDQITLAQAPAGTAPLGAPAVLQVATLSGSAVATVTVVNQIYGSSSNQAGSYFAKQTATQAQGSTTGSGTGATFSLTFGPQGDQRVILTNEEYPTLAYCRLITDPNVMDSLFQEAWVQVLGGGLCFALTGDKALANLCIAKANDAIAKARKVDGDEGLTVNDVTPDWMRIRGINWPEYYTGPWSGYDWGPGWGMF